MLSSLLWVVLTQVVVCTPGETSLVCNCKLGMVSACVTLVGEDTRKAAQNSEATPQEFMDKLREIYSRPEMKARFPHGF
jgi:hypothetical protein